MRWAAFVDILNNPSKSVDRFNFSEIRADRESRRYPPHRLMKEACVAGPETPDKIVHRQFEDLGIFDRHDPLTLAFRALGPAGAVEPGIEITPEDGLLRSIENFGALRPTEPLWSVEGFFSCHLQLP